MTFHQNNFLGTTSDSGDFQAQIDALDNKAFFKDGSRSMEGTLSLDNNILIGASVAEFNNQTSGILPASGKLSLYSKLDKHMYIQDDSGLETDLSSGGDVDSSSIPSINNRLAVYDGVTGELIKQSTTITETSGTLSGVQDINLLQDGNGITKYGYLAANSATATGLTVFGESAGTSITSGIRNSAFGYLSLANETTGSQNSAFGYQCMNSQDGGIGNSCFGYFAGENISSGLQNSAFGALALSNHTTGSNTTCIGYAAGSNHQGGDNVTIGSQAMNNSGTGNRNVAVGRQSAQANGAGTDNVCLGYQTMNNTTTGSRNICLGSSAGTSLATSDSDNILISHNGVGTDNGIIRIGTSGTHTSCNISGIYNVSPFGGSNEMVIQSSTGFMGTQSIPVVDPNAVLASSTFGTNNRLLRSDGVARNAQSSGVTLDDSDNLSGISGFQANGAIDFDTCTTFNVETTSNTTTACRIEASGGTSADIFIVNNTGTTGDSIRIDSVLGGIDIDAENTIEINSSVGRIDLNAVSSTSAGAIQLNAVAGGIQFDSVLGTDVLTGGFSVAGNPVVTHTSGTVTNNAITRYDGTTGNLIQETSVIIDDSQNTTGGLNHTITGQYSSPFSVLINTIDGSGNTFYGFDALSSVSGASNTAIGSEAGAGSLSANNTLVGKQCGQTSTGSEMTCIGSQAGKSSAGALNCTYVGSDCAPTCTLNNNVCVGRRALFAGTTCSGNTIIGSGAASSLALGDDNIIIGNSAGLGISGIESDNIFIANSGQSGDDGEIRIGNNSVHDGLTIPSRLSITESSGSETVTIRAPSLVSSYTFTLPDKSIVTDEVSALINLNGICSWSSGNEIPLPFGYMRGFAAFWNSDSQFTMGTASEDSVCRDSTNTHNIVFSGSQAVVISTSGINGLSASFTEASSTSYDVYACFDENRVEPSAYLMMPESTDPLTVTEFTSGDYSHFRKVMWVRNAASSDYLKFIVGGKGNLKSYSYDEDKTLLTVLSAGSATSWTNISLASFKPVESEFVQLRIAMGGVVPANGDLRLRPDLSFVSGVNALYTVSPGDGMASGNFHDAFIAMPTRVRQIEYEVSDAAIDAFIYITGFAFEL